jgi:hypothetical protein
MDMEIACVCLEFVFLGWAGLVDNDHIDFIVLSSGNSGASLM